MEGTRGRKCLHIINGEHYSGAERVQDLLALSLPEFGFEVEFATLKDGKFASNRRSTVPIHPFPMRGKLDWGTSRQIAKLVQGSDFELLHAHTPRSLMVAAGVAKRTGLPLLYHVHSPVGKDSTRWLQNKINLFIENRSLKQVTRLIAVSDSIRDYMLGLGHPAGSISVVPNGVPIVDDAQIDRISAEPLFKSPWSWTLGTIALFRPRKGTEILLEATAQLVKQGLDVGVLAVGGFETPEYEQSLRDMTAKLGLNDRVHWVGFTQQVNQHIPSMDIFVLPSLFGEGLPMVVLESLALGCPVVASRVEGIQETIRDAVDGCIVNPGDPAALAARLQSLLAAPDELKRLGQQGKERQRDGFSDRSMSQKTAAIYRELLAQGS